MPAGPRPAGPGASARDVHDLALGELEHAFLAELGPDARLLGAAEGNPRVELAVLVDPDRARLHAGRERVRDGLEKLHPSIRRFTYPHTYPVGLERSLHDLRTQLIFEARAHSEEGQNNDG